MNQSPGISYLWFAARRTKREPERHAIFPITFNFELFFPRSKQPRQDLEQTAAVLWLLTRLGGVGARSRRFAGGLQVAEVKSGDGQGLVNQLPVRAQSPKALVDDIAGGIKKARCAFNITLVSPAPDQFDVLHPDCCQIFVLNTVFPSWEDAVGKIGEIYQKFRKLRQPDYDVVKTAMSSVSNLQGTVDRAAFGLPVPFFYRSLNNLTATLQAKEQGGDDIDRRSSPLWMRVVKLGNGQYTVVFTWFKSQFLPTGATLLLTERSRKDLHVQQLPNDQLITVFLTENDRKNRSSLKDADYGVLEVPLQ